MKLTQLRALVAIARAGSIQEAANLIGLSQPALSKTVRALEQEMGAPLLERGARGVSLTEYGRVVVKRSLTIEREIDRLNEEVGWLKAEFAGRLTIGFTPLAGGVILASAVAQLRRLHPAVDVQLIEVRPYQILEGLRESSFDLGLLTLHGATSLPGFVTHTLASYPTRLVAGGRRETTELSIEKVLQEEWIETELADKPQSYIQTLAASAGLNPPARILHCTSISLAVELAAELGAICGMAAHAVAYFQKKIEDGVLTPLNIDSPLPTMNCIAAYSHGDRLTPAARELAKILRILGREATLRFGAVAHDSNSAPSAAQENLVRHSA